VSAVTSRVHAAEERAAADADTRTEAGGPSTALVLADRAVTVRLQAQQAYPRTRTSRITYTGSGYGDGYREGQNADIGGAKVGRGATPALTG
jgi:hypothetical protein